jgi:hypothetical protein
MYTTKTPQEANELRCERPISFGVKGQSTFAVLLNDRPKKGEERPHPGRANQPPTKSWGYYTRL